MLRHRGFYLTDHTEHSSVLGELKGWTRNFDCDTHENMHWRFDGNYLINEMGSYLARKISGQGPNYRIYLQIPQKGHLADVDFNDDRLFWEYDPLTKLLGYPTPTPLYLSRHCSTNQKEATRYCNSELLGRPKLTDDAITTDNEEIEQIFLLDYQGNFVSLDSWFQLSSVSVDQVLRGKQLLQKLVRHQ